MCNYNYWILGQLQSCRNCSRYFTPPNSWIYAELESKELMSICLSKMKSTMQKVRLIDAAFIWTEPHSKRIKIKLVIQKEVFSHAVLQQSFVVEFYILNQVLLRIFYIFWQLPPFLEVKIKCFFLSKNFHLSVLGSLISNMISKLSY